MDYRKRVDEVRHRIDEVNEQVRDALQTVGEFLYEAQRDHGGIADDDELVQLVTQVDTVHHEMADLDDRQDRIEQLTTERENLTDAIATEKTNGESLRQELPEHYDRIGEEAFVVYRERRDASRLLEGPLTPLIERFKEINRIETQIADLEREDSGRNIFGRVVDGGKLAVLRARRSARERTKVQVTRGCGRSVADLADQLADIDDRSFQSVLQPYLALRGRIDESARRIEHLVEDRASIDEQLRGLQAEKPRKAIAEIQTRRDAAAERLLVLHRSIGERLEAELAEEEAIPDAVREPMERLSSLRDESTRQRSLLDRLQAAIEVDRLDRDIQALDRHVAAADEIIRRKQAEIADLNARIEETKSERGKAIERRGSVADLGGE